MYLHSVAACTYIEGLRLCRSELVDMVYHWGESQTFFLTKFLGIELWSNDANDCTLSSWGKIWADSRNIKNVPSRFASLCILQFCIAWITAFNSCSYRLSELTLCTFNLIFFKRKEYSAVPTFLFLGTALQLLF